MFDDDLLTNAFNLAVLSYKKYHLESFVEEKRETADRRHESTAPLPEPSCIADAGKEAEPSASSQENRWREIIHLTARVLTKISHAGCQKERRILDPSHWNKYKI